MKTMLKWRAYYKNGVCNQTIVEAPDETEAKKEALAFFRKNHEAVDPWPIEKIVDQVVPVMPQEPAEKIEEAAASSQDEAGDLI